MFVKVPRNLFNNRITKFVVLRNYKSTSETFAKLRAEAELWKNVESSWAQVVITNTYYFCVRWEYLRRGTEIRLLEKESDLDLCFSLTEVPLIVHFFVKYIRTQRYLKNGVLQCSRLIKLAIERVKNLKDLSTCLLRTRRKPDRINSCPYSAVRRAWRQIKLLLVNLQYMWGCCSTEVWSVIRNCLCQSVLFAQFNYL